MDFDKESKIDSQESQADNEESKDTLGALGSVSDSFIDGIVWHLFSGYILFLSFISFFLYNITARKTMVFRPWVEWH